MPTYNKFKSWSKKQKSYYTSLSYKKRGAKGAARFYNVSKSTIYRNLPPISKRKYEKIQYSGLFLDLKVKSENDFYNVKDKDGKIIEKKPTNKSFNWKWKINFRTWLGRNQQSLSKREVRKKFPDIIKKIDEWIERKFTSSKITILSVEKVHFYSKRKGFRKPESIEYIQQRLT